MLWINIILEQEFCKSDLITFLCEKTGALAIVEPVYKFRHVKVENYQILKHHQISRQKGQVITTVRTIPMS